MHYTHYTLTILCSVESYVLWRNNMCGVQTHKFARQAATTVPEEQAVDKGADPRVDPWCYQTIKEPMLPVLPPLPLLPPVVSAADQEVMRIDQEVMRIDQEVPVDLYTTDPRPINRSVRPVGTGGDGPAEGSTGAEGSLALEESAEARKAKRAKERAQMKLKYLEKAQAVAAQRRSFGLVQKDGEVEQEAKEEEVEQEAKEEEAEQEETQSKPSPLLVSAARARKGQIKSRLLAIPKKKTAEQSAAEEQVPVMEQSAAEGGVPVMDSLLTPFRKSVLEDGGTRM
jgi:hypothetical protein